MDQETCSVRQYVPDGSFESHRKAGHFGMSSYEAHSMAPEDSLACPRILGEDHFSVQISPSSPVVVARCKQCTSMLASAPPSTHSAAV